MQLRVALLAVMLAALQAAAFPCSPSNLADCPKPPGALTTDQIPQFITITWDDAITSPAYTLIQAIVGGLKQRNGCPVPSTFYVTATNTIPAAVQALYLGSNEIATHTVTHVSYPSAEEIVGARDWLVNNTGIPVEKINGFRAPFLLHNADMRAALEEAGFKYDSSMPDIVPSLISPTVEQRGWPYKMDQGLPQVCSTGSCSPSEMYDLWEIPLWSVMDAELRPVASMDPPGNAYENYKRELDWRMAGNRAPLGLFFHAGLQSEATRVKELREFIHYAAALPDVWFVTNQQLLAWMENPVPASRADTFMKCDTPTDIDPSVGSVCATFVGDCIFGSFDQETCRCKCMGEGVSGGYCPDATTGECTSTCP